MNAISPDQITTECMDCGRQYISARPATAPPRAALYVVHCGCKAQPTEDEPFYIDGDGELIDDGNASGAPP
jgi:hypothetical protein